MNLITGYSGHCLGNQQVQLTSGIEGSGTSSTRMIHGCKGGGICPMMGEFKYCPCRKYYKLRFRWNLLALKSIILSHLTPKD